MHVHSFWSHDSEGTLFDIIPAASIPESVLFSLPITPVETLILYHEDIKGYYDGILIEPGSEKQGFAVWPLDTVIIDWNIDKDTIAKKYRQ